MAVLVDGSGRVIESSGSALTGTAGGPLNIFTQFVPFGTQNIAFSYPLVATGGTPPYTWTLTSPITPANGTLTLTSAGVVSGTPVNVQNGGSQMTFTAKVTDAASNTQSRAYTMAVNPKPMTSYSLASTSQAVIAEPAVPTAGAIGWIHNDDISGYRILRVTDATLSTSPYASPGSGFCLSDGSSETPRWSALGNYCMVHSTGGGIDLILSFNKAAFTTTQVSPGGHPAWHWSNGSLTWHPTNDIIALATCDTGLYSSSSGQAIWQLDVTTGTTTQLFDLRSVTSVWAPTNGAVNLSVGDNMNMALRVNDIQDTPGVVVWIEQLQTMHVFDPVAGTIDGVAAPGWSAPATTGIHNVRMGQDGRYVKISMSAGGGYIVWDTALQQVYMLDRLGTNGAPWYINGHQAVAWGKMINNYSLPPQAYWWGGWMIRDCTSQAGCNAPSNSYPAPTAQPNPAGSWETYGCMVNSVNGMSIPFLWHSSLDPTQTLVTTAYEREEVMVATDGSGTTWRLGHNFAYFPGSGPDFYAGVGGNISRDGKYVLFGSSWGNTLGGSSTPFRKDCFILECTT